MPVAAETRIKVKTPQGVDVEYNKNKILTIKGPKGSISRNFNHPRVKMEIQDENIISYCPLPRKKEKALAGTWAAHARNMIVGVTKGFEYRMKIVYAHFPVKVKFDKKNSFLTISNFLGEKSERKARIMDGVNVKVDGDQVIISGTNLESVGQSAANIERSTKIKRFDPRVFQDGIYITHKAIHGDVNG